MKANLLTMALRNRRKRAFTVLELLVVVVVLGILAGLMLVRFAGVNEKAYIATMKSDLRNFASARAIHVAEQNGVPGSVAEVVGYDFSENVFEDEYTSESDLVWMLRVGHDDTETTCTISALDPSRSHQLSCSSEAGESEGEEGEGGGEPVPPAEPNQAPIASFESPSIGIVGEPVSFVSRSTDPDGDDGDLIVSWDFNNDGISDATGASVSNSFAAGTYLVRMSVQDPGGLTDSDQRYITISTPTELALPSAFSNSLWVGNANTQRGVTEVRFLASTASIRTDINKTIVATDMGSNPGAKAVTLNTEWTRHVVRSTVNASGYFFQWEADIRASDARLAGAQMGLCIRETGPGTIRLFLGALSNYDCGLGGVANTAHTGGDYSGATVQFQNMKVYQVPVP